MMRKRMKNRTHLVLIVQKEYKYKRNCNPSREGIRNYQLGTRLNLNFLLTNNNMCILAPKNHKRAKKPLRRNRKFCIRTTFSFNSNMMKNRNMKKLVRMKIIKHLLLSKNRMICLNLVVAIQLILNNLFNNN